MHKLQEILKCLQIIIKKLKHVHQVEMLHYTEACYYCQAPNLWTCPLNNLRFWLFCPEVWRICLNVSQALVKTMENHSGSKHRSSALHLKDEPDTYQTDAAAFLSSEAQLVCVQRCVSLLCAYAFKEGNAQQKRAVQCDKSPGAGILSVT